MPISNLNAETPQIKLTTVATTNTDNKADKTKNSKDTAVKVAVGVGLAALASVGIYLATRGRGKAESSANTIKEMTMDSFKKDGKFVKGKAVTASGENYTGKLTKDLNDGSTLTREYQDGVLQSVTKTKDGNVISSKSYSYDENGNLAKVVDKDGKTLFEPKTETKATETVTQETETATAEQKTQSAPEEAPQQAVTQVQEKPQAEVKAETKPKVEEKAQTKADAETKTAEDTAVKSEAEASRAAEQAQYTKQVKTAKDVVKKEMKKLDEIILNKDGKISYNTNDGVHEISLDELVKPYGEELGTIYHSTTPEAKASIMKNGFSEDIAPVNGHKDGIGGTYFTRENNTIYGNSVVAAEFTGKVGQADMDIINAIKNDTFKVMDVEDFARGLGQYDSGSISGQTIIQQYLRQKVADMGYQGILGTNISMTAKCRYFAALDPSLIKIIS